MDQIPSGSSLADRVAENEAGGQIQQSASSLVEGKQSSQSFSGLQQIQEKMYQLDLNYPKGLPYEPQSYCGQPETHLDIQNLVEEDKDKRERANFFLCAICAMVVREPKECGSCQSLFCQACIQPWCANNESCPKKCQGNNAVQFQNLHRYVKQDLLGLKFKCGLPECDFVGSYEDAMKHYGECKHQFIQCTQGCGLGIVGRDMEYHCLKQCKMFKIQCENCEETAYPNDSERGGKGIDGHDCIQVLKANLKAAREEIDRLKKGGAPQGSVQGGSLTVHCSSGCVLEKFHGQPPGYGGQARCDVCQYSGLENYEYFYHCRQCQYDLCKVCALQAAGVLQANQSGRFMIRNHGCPMKYEPYGDRHYGAHNCDGTQLLGPGSRCQSNTIYNLGNKNQQYLFCDTCNIDVCVCCVDTLCRM